jgi:hypothetical protein
VNDAAATRSDNTTAVAHKTRAREQHIINTCSFSQPHATQGERGKVPLQKYLSIYFTLKQPNVSQNLKEITLAQNTFKDDYRDTGDGETQSAQVSLPRRGRFIFYAKCCADSQASYPFGTEPTGSTGIRMYGGESYDHSDRNT